LYNDDFVEENAILSWEDEKKDADEADKVFVKQAQKLIQVSTHCLFFLTYRARFYATCVFTIYKMHYFWGKPFNVSCCSG